MSDFFIGWLVGWVFLAIVMWVKGTSPGALADKHCQHITDRNRFTECREEFLK